MWSHEEEIEAFATPLDVWALFSDVQRWKEWNTGIEEIRINGPFAAGTTFEMQPPGQDAMTSTLTAVSPGVAFSDETMVGNTCVRVHHELTPLPSGRTRIVYRTEITGERAAELGPMVTGDFADVLANLKILAEQRHTHSSTQPGNLRDSTP